MNDHTKEERQSARNVLLFIDAIQSRNKAAQSIEDAAFEWMDANLIGMSASRALEFMTAVALAALEMMENKEGAQ